MTLRNIRHGITKTEIRRLVGSAVAAPVVLDIGCNDGTDSLETAATLRRGEIHCFECDPRALARFHARRNIPKNIFIHATAVGDVDGTLPLHMSGGTVAGAHLNDWDLSSSLQQPTGHLTRHAWCKFEKTCDVPVIRLDTWLARNPRRQIDFIWLDVQGAEGRVFAGGREALVITRYVYCEFNDTQELLYEGALTLEATRASLGPAWQPVATYDGYNVLLQNTRFKPRK